MPRGGARSNSGPKSQWRHGQTKTIRVPEALVDQLLAIAHQLDQAGTYEIVSGSSGTAANLSFSDGVTSSNLTSLSREEGDALHVLQEELRQLSSEEQDRRLSRHLEQVAALRVALTPVPVASTITLDPRPWWIEPIGKQLQKIPKKLSRLLVVRLLLNHQSYTQERYDDFSRRPLPKDAGAAEHARREDSLQRLARRIRELELFCSSLPPELVAEARDFEPQWHTRTAAGARRTYDSMIAKIDT